jgi:(2Fe-2S) ferredoxin
MAPVIFRFERSYPDRMKKKRRFRISHNARNATTLQNSRISEGRTAFGAFRARRAMRRFGEVGVVTYKAWGIAAVAVLLFLGSAFVGMVGLVPAEAGAAEKLLVCGPCSGAFLSTASRVVEELGCSDRVVVVRSSCLGPCSQGVVIAFRGEVYSNMTEDLLRTLLEATFSDDTDAKPAN